MRPFKLAFLAVMVAATTAIASASAHEVFQSGKKFSVRKMTVKIGDTVEFVNDDSTTHNVHSSTAGYEFDLGAQAPGSSTSHVFLIPGKIKVRCAIHPKMKINITVVE